ncbi:hypothetical protein KFK09_007515 [Dendrobium nobile]|uniref:Uncharacterized protein n=1 Tax=Dendrobium nobile TaxID=94219 RepID=A0A8T3BUB8_DENNO|nr:hypothetical protein KFK09_007515 [Dendrobium nobile]
MRQSPSSPRKLSPLELSMLSNTSTGKFLSNHSFIHSLAQNKGNEAINSRVQRLKKIKGQLALWHATTPMKGVQREIITTPKQIRKCINKIK